MNFVKIRLKVESKRLVNDVNVLKDQLTMKDNLIRNLESNFTTSNDNLANVQDEIHNLQLKLEISKQETNSLQLKLIKANVLLINLLWVVINSIKCYA